MALQIGDIVKLKKGTELGRVCEITPLGKCKVKFVHSGMLNCPCEDLELATGGEVPPCPQKTTPRLG